MKFLMLACVLCGACADLSGGAAFVMDADAQNTAAAEADMYAPSCALVYPEEGLADQDHDGAPAEVDCDDHNPAIRPGVFEVCDYLDNNCNGFTDDPWSVGEFKEWYRKPCIAVSFPEPGCISEGIWGCNADGKALSCNAQPRASWSMDPCAGIDDWCNVWRDDRDPGPPLHSVCTTGEGACKIIGTWECDIYTRNPYCTAERAVDVAVDCTNTAAFK